MDQFTEGCFEISLIYTKVIAKCHLPEVDLERACFRKSIDTKLSQKHCKRLCYFVGKYVTAMVASRL